MSQVIMFTTASFFYYLTQVQIDTRIERNYILSVGCGPKAYTHQKDRKIFSDLGCKLYAWSSRGVVVIKDNADAVDLMFLGIDRLDPQLGSNDDQEAEDALQGDC
jgi:hypothetical protein